MHGWRLVYICIHWLCYDSNTLLCVVHCCIGAPLVNAGYCVRTDAAGWPACEHCGLRYQRCKGRMYPMEIGKMCIKCYLKVTKRRSAAVPVNTSQPLPAVRSHKRSIPVPIAVPTIIDEPQRSTLSRRGSKRLKPYDQLQKTQRAKRNKQAVEAVNEVLNELAVPLAVIAQPKPITAEELLHTSAAERHRMRTVPSIVLPCEQI